MVDNYSRNVSLGDAVLLFLTHANFKLVEEHGVMDPQVSNDRFRQ